MRKVLLGLLTVVVVLGLLGATGFAGYRFGYVQGLQATANNSNPARPQLRPFNNFGGRGMPMRPFGFERGFGRGGFPMMGFGFFGPLIFLGRIAILALLVLFIYWLFMRSGWRLTRQPVESTPAKTEVESSSSKTDKENE